MAKAIYLIGTVRQTPKETIVRELSQLYSHNCSKTIMRTRTYSLVRPPCRRLIMTGIGIFHSKTIDCLNTRIMLPLAQTCDKETISVQGSNCCRLGTSSHRKKPCSKEEEVDRATCWRCRRSKSCSSRRTATSVDSRVELCTRYKIFVSRAINSPSLRRSNRSKIRMRII